jgi:type VI secretion system protein ImpK
MAFDDLDPEDDRDRDLDRDEEDDERPRRSARRQRPPARGRETRRGASRRDEGGLWSRLFPSKRAESRRPLRRDRMEWDVADDDERYEARRGRSDREDEEVHEAPRRRERLSLMDLASPIFGYAAILPREAGGVHPSYPQFRQEVLAALQKIESEAAEHGIEREDAAEARFALAAFMDEQVADSEWSGRSQWSSEPLYMVLLNDPQAGVNFFSRLEGLGDRQRTVKEVYLVCLAMGFRGKFAELDPTQQAARIGEIRQKTIRSIHRKPLDGMDVLFPEAYEPAVPIETEAPPPPRPWVLLSAGVVALAVILYFVLYWAAGGLPRDAQKTLEKLDVAEGAEGVSR